MNGNWIAFSAAIAILSVIATSIGEAWIAVKAIEGISRNPEAYEKLRLSMIIGIGLNETCALYALVVALTIIFKFSA